MKDIASQKGFKIVHLNIRSLVNKYEQLKLELEYTNIYIFSVSETWLTEGVNSKILNIKGYNLERHDRCLIDVDTGIPKRGGGLCIYYRENLVCDKSKWEAYNVSNADLELQIVELQREKARNMILFNVYRPPNGSVGTMVDHLNMVLSNVPRMDRKDIIILGDFNVNMFADDADTRKLLKFGQVNEVEQLIKKPTRCTVNTTSLIDLLYSNVTHVYASGVLDLFLSDHMPIYMIKKMDTRKTRDHVTFVGRTYRNYSAELLQERIDREIDVEQLLLNNDPVKCWDSLYGSLVTLADKIIPRKEYKVKTERPAWITDELLNLKNDRDYFFKKAKITGEEGDWFVARNLRNRVNIAMRSAKADFIKNQLDQSRNNPKKFWNLIQSEILPEERKKIFNFKNRETGILQEQSDLPDVINDFFVEIGPKLAEKIDKPNVGETTIFGESNPEKFELNPFGIDELIGSIKTISIYKSSGLPDLSTRFLRDAMLYIPRVFLHIYNRVRLTGIFPDTWKIATVVPLPKCSNPSDSSELRPVSLLPIVGKLLEKLIHSQISKFLENSKFLS